MSARTLSAPSRVGRCAARAPVWVSPSCTARLKSIGHRCAHCAVCLATKSSQQDSSGPTSSLSNSDRNKPTNSSNKDNGAPSEQGIPTFSRSLMSGDHLMAPYLSDRVRQVSQHFPTA
eukprot:CAMPEP_0206140516 /NCGR_PEP_ID=MMETSP1473-20131121/9610_1 /ASSEMBLY_ACC=CAM_ASM_001109 /TAXON_ID=1461547 /ORGANISM="Stichococcus sp, Strain RCC1054" /LENGTH=117 /DNA_ID=CAMNT_0053534679 /DNA_START=314 /DNA_END=664 /DNA_ORIENTATION=-